ncbi:hypothetical protein [Planomonospora venezuelensis]|uniref:Uncharacterized protein n=1 Tax=Planomonospora venezuelensis TaxID=1999 RepID=A0A841D1U8_PLAVE|nr:hypothetical protein [Planomonospora venezuelensis]MBB5964231.1 hypothetical protein [Planomonospora venezuelensis]GIN02546.1 hypothetical protein Pve01_42040 [Planomonospora venezuelensis]
MPLYIPRENTGYLGGAVPTLVLVSTDPVEKLPVFQLDAGRPLPCDGWCILAGLTASVVDGPDDAGIFVDGMTSPEEAEERFAWLEAVDRAGGAVVLVVDSHSTVDDWAALAAGGKAQGGFVPAVQRTG